MFERRLSRVSVYRISSVLLGNFLRSSGNAFDVHANRIRTMDNTEREKETLIRNDRITTTRKSVFGQAAGSINERRNNSILYGRESGRGKR